MPSVSKLEPLFDWIRTESPTSDHVAVNAMVDRVVGHVADAPVSVERIPGRDGLGDVIVLRAGPATAAPATVILSHLDTVHPIGTIAKDLPLRVDGDRLYGPGVYDMKGGVFLALEAFKEVASTGLAARPLIFLMTPDEEIGSPTSRPIIEHLARDAACALVTEPARDGGKIVTSRKGVGHFDIQVVGKSAHAGLRHQEGRNAIHEAARLIMAIAAMTDYTRGTTTTVGMIQGGTASNTIPQNCRFPVDMRVETMEEGARLTEVISGLAAKDRGFEVIVSGGLNRPPFERGAGTELLFNHARTLAAEIGFDLISADRVGGGSDGNFTAALGVPTLDGLGIDGDGAHTFNEYGLISSIEPRKALFKRLLETQIHPAS